MVPRLSLSMQLQLEAARRELQVMDHQDLLALADRLITQSTMQEVCLRNSLKRIAELEISNAIQIADQKRQNSANWPGAGDTRRHFTRWIVIAWRQLLGLLHSGAGDGSGSTGSAAGAAAPSNSDS